ncbi:MAG: hypothetical protein MUE83_13110 [Tabrizicola sp.]|jgi:hypothetical protein|nr:hypothetical protein [Tabrizicola sp.]
MLRLLIGSGVLLMAVGFGAAGWQYWQSLPKSDPTEATTGEATTGEAATAGAATSEAAGAPTAVGQGWLISPTGAQIPAQDVRAYLAQERFAPQRTVTMTLQASLASLLAEGEKLPEVDYLQALADIRAPRVAEGLCAVVLQSLATDCAVNAARVVEGSVDPMAGTARFRVELVFRLAEAADGLPDLAAHVLNGDIAQLALDPGAAGTESAEAALAAALRSATEACAADGVGQLCRLMQLAVVWAPGGPMQAQARIAWLDPLPDGIFAAPPLTPILEE